MSFVNSDRKNPGSYISFVEAVQNSKPVSGLTHGFYRYPARFSPEFAKEAIKIFSNPGDLIYDPFMGGGTTLVEAFALGRKSIGTDINDLAVFVTKVKTTLYSKNDLRILDSWFETLLENLNIRKPSIRAEEWIELGYQKNINGKSTWRIRKIIELALFQIKRLPNTRQQNFARCVLLKTAQWALDCRYQIPKTVEFRKKILSIYSELREGATDFREKVKESQQECIYYNLLKPNCLSRSAIGIEEEKCFSKLGSPKLILTSPPYPGVHALYHRWQVRGRKETPAPYWIANTFDGNGAAYYTFGGRKQTQLINYYEKALLAFKSVGQISDENTLVVQMVAFSSSEWQLTKYLDTMNEAGFEEIKFSEFANGTDNRLWRKVPNRKWYANFKGSTPSSKEVVLFHKLK